MNGADETPASARHSRAEAKAAGYRGRFPRREDTGCLRPGPEDGRLQGRHAGRSRGRGWAVLWLAAAVFGALPLTEGSLDGAVAYWFVMAAGLVYTQVMLSRVKRGRRRK